MATSKHSHPLDGFSGFSEYVIAKVTSSVIGSSAINIIFPDNRFNKKY